MTRKPDGQRPASGEQVQGPRRRKRPDVYSLRRKINQLNLKLDDAGFPPPFMDQYPGKRVPFAYSKRYGPVPITVTRRNGSTGFEGLCTVATPDEYLLPLNGNINVSVNTDFWLCGVSVYVYYSLTYGTGSSYTVATFSSGGDLFSPVPAPSNGGGIPLTQLADPRLSTDLADDLATGALQGCGLDLDLYDRNKAGKMTEFPIPTIMFSGQAAANKDIPVNSVWEGGSEIEPRIYVRAMNGMPADATDASINAAIFKAWPIVVFHGFTELR